MKQLLIICCSLIILISCTKQGTENNICADGYIYWGGAYAVDGLGWYFAENRSPGYAVKQLKEEELPNEVKNKTDSTAVFICLVTTTERAPCFCVQPSYFYKVVSLKKK